VSLVPVAGTTLGGGPGLFSTDPSGNYSLSGFGMGAFTISPNRPNILSSASNGIFSNDAALISRHVVGLTVLNPIQQRAARVGGGGTITSADAGLVARWIVGFNDAGNQTGQWKFTPAARMYASVINSQFNQDYLALLMGDVSGDWTPGLPRKAEPSSLFTTRAVVSAPNVAVQQGSEIKLPIRIDGLASTGVSSYQFDLEYDPMVITPDAVAAELSGTLSDSLSVASNVIKPGVLRVVVYGAMPVYGDGVYIGLRFTATGRVWSSSKLVIKGFRFNDGDEQVTAVAGQVAIDGSAVEPVLGGARP